MRSLMPQPIVEGGQTLNTIVLTAILYSNQLLSLSKITWSNCNIKFCGCARETSSPSSAPLVPSDQDPSTYRRPDWLDQEKCLFALEVLPLDRSDQIIFLRRFWLDHLSWLYNLHWSVQELILPSSDLIGSFKLSAYFPRSDQELLHFWAIWLDRPKLIVSSSRFSWRAFFHFEQYHWSGLFEKLYLPQESPLAHSSGTFHPFEKFDWPDNFFS